ncbi:MAG: hypothetical protein LBV29_02905, partial [Azoarcus sp.]|nr:hypothetical protein [Azoarcus sp.]
MAYTPPAFDAVNFGWSGKLPYTPPASDAVNFGPQWDDEAPPAILIVAAKGVFTAATAVLNAAGSVVGPVGAIGRFAGSSSIVGVGYPIRAVPAQSTISGTSTLAAKAVQMGVFSAEGNITAASVLTGRAVSPTRGVFNSSSTLAGRGARTVGGAGELEGWSELIGETLRVKFAATFAGTSTLECEGGSVHGKQGFFFGAGSLLAATGFHSGIVERAPRLTCTATLTGDTYREFSTQFNDPQWPYGPAPSGLGSVFNPSVVSVGLQARAGQFPARRSGAVDDREIKLTGEG